MRPPEEMVDLRWIIQGRVSSASQTDNTSIGKQLSDLRDEIETRDGRVVKAYDLTESAASMDRESLEEIAELAEEDRFDVLGIWKLDRLTRASPWETIRYLDRLRQAGVTLYADTHGYFEWDDLYDFEMLARRTVFAREWYQRIIEGGHEDQLTLLEEGKWAFGSTPYGYTTNDNQETMLTERGEEINCDIVQLYLELESIAAVKREIDNRYDNGPSEDQIGTILENQILLGHLTLKDRTVRVEEDLRIIDRETFDQVQQIREENSPSASSVRNVPEAVDRAANRLRVQFVVEIIGSIGTQCRKCGSDVKPNGTTERWGTTVRKYACKDDDCGYEGPLVKQAEFNDLHQTLPLRCPYCPGTEQFKVQERDGGYWRYKYECEMCGKSMGSNMPPNRIKRAMEHPKLAFKWDQKANLSASNDEQKDMEGTSTKEADSSQTTLSAY